MLSSLKRLLSERSIGVGNGRATLSDIDAIKADICSRLSASNMPLPTDDQFAVVLSGAPSTRVVAGAGSGKSTTLVLRCIYLHWYRGVPWEQITVVTFTRNSRRDFIAKLDECARCWKLDLPEKLLSRVVRTFHSLAFAQASAAGLHAQLIDQQPAPGTESNASELPFAPLAVPEDSELAVLLNEVARELMREDEVFRACVMGLYDASFVAAGSTQKDDAAQDRRIAAVQAHDQARTAYMEQLWRERFAPDLMKLPLISFDPGRFLTGSLRDGRERNIANGPWWGNAFIPQLNAWLMLGASAAMSDQLRMPDGFSVGAALGAKKSCVNVITSTTPVIWVNTPEDLMRLHHRLQWQPEQATEFPKFSIRLTGESTPVPFLIALWQQAQFIQSLALDVRQASLRGATEASGIDSLFARALSRFWPAFERALAYRGLATSNGVFGQLADRATLERVPNPSLSCCAHLLIDEFQDVSGNIVKWLVAVRAELFRRGVKTSLTVVGDDWQSIYGWRGASPRYFTEFDFYFNSRGGQRCRTVTLNENFRSSQNIIDAAEALIVGVKEKLPKRGVAKGQHANVSDRVHLGIFQGSHALEEDGSEIFPANASAFVIARTNAALNAWEKGSARGMTIHGSKGLEADYVLLIEDINPPSRHPLRQVWYAQADLGDYSQAQQDETHRLAYVALTRAKKGCVWLVPEKAPDGMFAILAESACEAVSLGSEVSHTPES